METMYPNVGPSVQVGHFRGRLSVRIFGGGDDKWKPLRTKDGRLAKQFSNELKKALGPPAEDIINTNEENNKVDEVRNREYREEMKRPGISKRDIKIISDRMNQGEEKISEREGVNGIIKERMSLKDRVGLIFKKHGFTVIAIISEVGAIIGVIISNLKTGLAKMATGVGNGLKDIGEKLGAILPGMIGAIASFIFKTAGDVLGFLAKNAWLLIIAVAVAVVDQFKKKNK